MLRKKKSRWGLFLKIFLPSVLGFVIILGGVVGYIVKTVTHPPKSAVDEEAPAQLTKVMSMYWEKKTFSSDGTQFNYWVLVFGGGAPGIVLTHGYGMNREDMLLLGYRLWERGFNVMMYDLRYHGNNKAEFSGLGALEKADLQNALKEFKGLKYNKDIGKISPAGIPLVDPDNIGVLGIDIGAYASLMVAADDDSVKGIVIDSPPLSPSDFTHNRLGKVFNLKSDLAYSLIDSGMDIYIKGKYNNAGSAIAAAQKIKTKSKKVLVISGGDNPIAKVSSKKIFDTIGLEHAQISTPAVTKFSSFTKETGDEYMGNVGDFFRNVVFLPPPPPPDGAQPPATGTTPTPAGTAPAPASPTPAPTTPAKK